MSYLTQKTLKKKVNFNGVALHSGNIVNISIKPAEPNFGIVFKRVDLDKNNLALSSPFIIASLLDFESKNILNQKSIVVWGILIIMFTAVYVTRTN